VEASRITLLKRAFRSGSSEFWRARLSGAGGFSRPVLVKRLTSDVAAEPRLVERERAEALLTGRLVHPNILAVLDYCLVDGQAVTVLEDVRAVDLLHLLERATVERRRLAPRLALGIAWSVLNALVHAHNRADPTLGIAGIAHGDLSPSNILIDMSGRVLLRDFGIPLQSPPKQAPGGPIGPGGVDAAMSAAAGNDPGVPAGEPLARLGRLHGKPGYMSPELVTRGIISPRSDVFAVGILLYELITFRRLFGAKDGAETLKAVALAQVDERITRYAGDLPMPLRELMRRALRRQPDERFASAADMLRALEAFFPGNPHEVAPELAHFVNDLAPPEEDDTASDDAAQPVRRRSGRRTPSRMILPPTGATANAAEALPTAEVVPDDDFEAEFEATQLWANNTPPPLVDVVTLLADIEPVGPPPLPPEAMEPGAVLIATAPVEASEHHERTALSAPMTRDEERMAAEPAGVISAMPDDIFEPLPARREPTFEPVAEPSAALLLFQEFAREVAIDPLSVEPPAIELPLRKVPTLDGLDMPSIPPPLPPPLPPEVPTGLRIRK